MDRLQVMLGRILFAAISCWPSGIAGDVAVRADELPNIVILYANDAGDADFGFHSVTDDAMRGLTPHIDSIAAQAARFTNACMSGAVCSPSRAGMLIGPLPGERPRFRLFFPDSCSSTFSTFHGKPRENRYR